MSEGLSLVSCCHIACPLKEVSRSEVPVQTGVGVSRLCTKILPCPRDLFLKGLMAELDISCSSDRQKSTFNFNYTLREKSNLKLLACFSFSLV